MKKRPAILFTSPILEHPAAGGPELRIENSIKALSRICELDVISGSPLSVGDAGKEAREFYLRYCQEFGILPSLIPQILSSNRYLRECQLAAGRLYLLCRTEIERNAYFILDHVDRRNIDVVWFGYGNISYPLIKCIKKSRPSLKVVCDTDSVWSRFVLRELPYVTGPRREQILQSGREKEAEERAWVNLCEVTTAVSDVDAEYYKSIAKDTSRIHLFSNVIDLESYKIAPPPPTGFKSPSVYLAGTFGHYNSPMDTAARWMLEEVLPHVLKIHPNVHFYIVGKNSEVCFGNLNSPNVTVTGRLETVLPYLCNTDVALVPLKFESGTRFKILEAGACKVPLVSTTLGAEGIPVVDGEHILIADEPEDFAQAILRLLDDKELAKRLAMNCCDLVRKNFSVESLTDEAKRILEYLDNA